MNLVLSVDTAYAAIIGGLLIGYLELIRPGSILPGVAGGVLVMLGIASFAAHPVRGLGAGLCLIALSLVIADACWKMRGAAAILGGIVLAFGARELTVPAIRWWTAWTLSLPFAWITAWLFGIALQARANKALP